MIASRAAQDKFRSLCNAVDTVQITDMLWERHLSEADREKLLPKTEAHARPNKQRFEAAIERYRNAAIMYYWVHGVSIQRAILDVAKLTNLLFESDYQWLLREFGELPPDEETAREQAIHRGDLVLDRMPPAMYWKGEHVEVDWIIHRASWDFFLIACEHAKRNEAIDRFKFGENAHQNVVTQKKSHLKSLKGFPLDLIETFKCIGRGTQQLKIPPEKIHIFARSDI